MVQLNENIIEKGHLLTTLLLLNPNETFPSESLTKDLTLHLKYELFKY